MLGVDQMCVLKQHIFATKHQASDLRATTHPTNTPITKTNITTTKAAVQWRQLLLPALLHPFELMEAISMACLCCQGDGQVAWGMTDVKLLHVLTLQDFVGPLTASNWLALMRAVISRPGGCVPKKEKTVRLIRCMCDCTA